MGWNVSWFGLSRVTNREARVSVTQLLRSGELHRYYPELITRSVTLLFIMAVTLFFIFVRMGRIFLTLDTIDVLCLFCSNLCEKSIYKVREQFFMKSKYQS